jgi:hypothetical protein
MPRSPYFNQLVSFAENADQADQPDLGGPAVMREFGRFDRPVAVIGA